MIMMIIIIIIYYSVETQLYKVSNEDTFYPITLSMFFNIY